MPRNPRKQKHSNKIGELPVLLQIILFILSLGLLYWLKTKQDESERRANIQKLIPEILAAIKTIEKKQNLLLYFSNAGAKKLLLTQHQLRKAIPKNYKTCGLDTSEKQIITRFVHNHDNLETIRAAYNQRFIQSEISEYKDFFASLEKYPLSTEQMRAIVSDEDNNLVIAGAGTGKTTTISAKIAYILEKNLSKAEELLVISFTNSAVEEMYDRTANFLKDKKMAGAITFKTFNSFGNLVNRYCSQHIKNIAFDGKDYRAKAFLQQSFDKLFLADSDFQQKAINFISFFSRPHRDEFNFKSGEDFIKHEKSYRNLSLNGTECKSQEEVMIANFLYLHKVEFKYEAPYPLEREDRNPDFGNYQPDFYLPDYNLYHEHYGIDENGNVPDYFKFRAPFTSAREQYQSGMQWKENIHEKYQTRLIKTYSFQNKNNSLLKALKQQLSANGVILNKRPADEILNKIKKLDDYQEFMGLIYTFLNLMKSNNASPGSLKNKDRDQRFSVFLDVFDPLYQSYEQELTRTGSIDYNDMVNLATAYIANGQFVKKYKYILIDEFQDMSLGRYALIKALKSANPEAKLYAVGDDWQSIFRFTGSDISIITGFAKHFGVTAQNSILQTYRFNDRILQASSGFIQSNPSQLKKQLSSPFKASLPALILQPQTTFGNKAQRAIQKFDTIKNVLEKIAADHPRGTVFLIGRYHHNAPGDLRELQKSFNDLKISYHTAHASKGLTCDVTILLDLDSGVFGFPSEMADDPILSNLLHEGENYENAEERRLFYVAMTRARHQIYMLYNPQNKSKFLEELIADFKIGDSSQNEKKVPNAAG